MEEVVDGVGVERWMAESAEEEERSGGGQGDFYGDMCTCKPLDRAI